MKVKIAIVHPKLGWGGSEVTTFWMLETLKKDYDITLITTGSVIDDKKVNDYYGTSLNTKEFSFIRAPLPFFLRNTNKFAALRGRFVQRYCQKIAPRFDVMISAYNFCDFKTRGIQLATDIQALPEIMPLPAVKNYWYGSTMLRRWYLLLCDAISPFKMDSCREDVIMSNSHWTAKLVQERYGMHSDVLYPPVAADFSGASNEKREYGFLIVGRLVPEKRIDMAVDILDKVRQRGYKATLHVIGSKGDLKYAQFLKSLFLKHKTWVFFEGKVNEERKRNLMESCQFGISCRTNEPFGIAVAEMVKAGSIVFVPHGGGQTEVVADERLIYRNKEDAVEKICRVLEDHHLQDNLRKLLSENIQKFSLDSFQEKVKEVVLNFKK